MFFLTTCVIYELYLLIVSGVSTSHDQRLYLRTFYNALDGQNWVEEWNITDDDTTLTRLLAQDHLTWNGDNLEAIDLTDKGLVGVVPDGISVLENLKTLKLSQNEINGTLPDLSKLINLQVLNVSYNLLTGYNGKLPASLQQLLMNNNSITMDISDIISTFTDINTAKSINLNSNQITGSLTTSNLLSSTSIENIDIAYNKLSGTLPSSIKSNGWNSLDLGYNSLSGNYPTSLEAVDITKKNVQCNMFQCTSLSNKTTYDIKECMCDKRGYEATVDSTTNNVQCTQCKNGTMANKWVRFGFLSTETRTTPVQDYYCPYPTEGCVPCMFPQNCVTGACATGSKGPTCETCEEGYRMVGGICQQCLESKVPIAALVMVIFVAVIIGYGIFLTGLNILAATMIKQLMSYLQIYYLTMDMKVPWPRYLGELSDVFKLSMLNTQAFDLDCLTDLSPLNLFYIHWTTTIVWPVIMTVIVISMDKAWSNRLKTKQVKDCEENALKDVKLAEETHLQTKLMGVRRSYIMFMIIAFVPITTLSVRMYACDAWAPNVVTVKYNDGNKILKNQWFYDNSVSCYDYTFQGVNFLATMFCVLEFGIVVFLFLILFRLWRFDLKDKHNEIFGALYESFNAGGLFCEPIMLLRKFLLILLTQVTYIDPLFSGSINGSLSFGWLMLILIRQPYIKATKSGRMAALLNNWCNLFEIASTLLITVTQIFALLYGIQKWEGLNMPVADYILSALHVILVLIWILGFIMVLVGVTRSGLRDRHSRRTQRKASIKKVVMNPMAGNTARVTPEESTTGTLEMEFPSKRISSEGVEDTGLLRAGPNRQESDM